MQNATEEQPESIPQEIVETPARVRVPIGKGVESAGHDTAKAAEAVGNDITKAAEPLARAIPEAVTPTPGLLKTPVDPVPEPAAPMA